MAKVRHIYDPDQEVWNDDVLRAVQRFAKKAGIEIESIIRKGTKNDKLELDDDVPDEVYQRIYDGVQSELDQEYGRKYR